MSYTKNTWSDGDIITANKMNNIEIGVESLDTDVGQLQADLDENIADLKADISELSSNINGQSSAVNVTSLSGVNFSKGNVKYSASSSYNTFYAPVTAGNVYDIKVETANAYERLAYSLSTPAANVPGSYITELSVRNSAVYRFTPEYDGFVSVSVASTSTVSVAVTQFAGGLEQNIIASEKTLTDKLYDVIGSVDYSTQAGYFGNGGIITSPTSNKEIYTSKIPVVPSAITFNIECNFQSSVSQWLCVVEYGSDFTYIKRTVLINTTSKTEKISYTPSGDNIAFVAFSWRTFDEDAVTITTTPNYIQEASAKAVDEKIIPQSFIKSVNHRGYSSVAPENTIPAYKLSKQKGFTYVETDICFTSDNVPVLLHDVTINRTARNSDGTTISGTITIHDITYADALEYDFGIWKGSQYAGTKLPTFEQFMECCRSLGLHPYIELKASPGSGGSAENIQTLYPIVKKYGMEKNVTWISGYNGHLSAIKAQDPNARLGIVADDLTETIVNQAVALKTEQNDVFITCNYTAITSEKIAIAVNGNIPVEAWTVNTASNIVSLDPYISGFTSNDLMASSVLYNAYMN